MCVLKALCFDKYSDFKGPPLVFRIDSQPAPAAPPYILGEQNVGEGGGGEDGGGGGGGGGGEGDSGGILRDSSLVVRFGELSSSSTSFINVCVCECVCVCVLIWQI